VEFSLEKQYIFNDNIVFSRIWLFEIKKDTIEVLSYIIYVLRQKQKSGWSENNHLYRRVEHWKFSIPVIEEVIEDMFVFYDHFDCLSFYFPTSVLRKFGFIIKPSFISVIPKSSNKIDLSLNQIDLSEV
jgi:hypothetical protein